MPVFFFKFQNVDICLGASEGPLSQHIVQQAANQPGTVLNFSSKLFCIIAVCGSNRNKFSVADPAAVGGSGQPLFVRRGGGGGIYRWKRCLSTGTSTLHFVHEDGIY